MIFEIDCVYSKQDWKSFVASNSHRLFGRSALVHSIGVLFGAVALTEALDWRWNDGQVIFEAVFATLVLHMLASILYSRYMVGVLMPRGLDVTGRRHFRISDERVEMTSDNFSASYQWSAIEAVFRRKGLIVFWTTPSVGFFIPERAIPNPNEFFAFAEKNLQAAH